MADYRSTTYIPPLVQQAIKLAAQMEFEHSCTTPVGRLLQVLTGGCRGGRVAEIGTGCGVGAAWIATGLPASGSLVTVELNPARAAAARSLFEGHSNIKVLDGDWHGILPYSPFDLLFADASAAKREEPELLIQMLAPGGLLLLDDLTPESLWPPEWRGQADPLRQFWLNEPRLHATEILTSPTTAAILASRVP